VVHLNGHPTTILPQRRELYQNLVPDFSDLPGRVLHVLDGVQHRSPIYSYPVDVSVEWIGADSKVLYIRSNEIISINKAPLDQKFLFGVLQANVVKQRPKYVIVGLRFNGGEFFNTILFAQALPKLIPQDGRIFVLVGPGTFSAALVTAAMLKANGGERAILVGETMGDNGQFWASPAGTKTLPNSQIKVTCTTLFEDWGRGCSNLDMCYWPVVAFGVQNASLKPEIRVQSTFTDYAAGRDPVLETVVSMAK
jgi:hypothetical protein